MLFQKLNETDADEYRQWAHDNHCAGDRINTVNGNNGLTSCYKLNMLVQCNIKQMNFAYNATATHTSQTGLVANHRFTSHAGILQWYGPPDIIDFYDIGAVSVMPVVSVMSVVSAVPVGWQSSRNEESLATSNELSSSSSSNTASNSNIVSSSTAIIVSMPAKHMATHTISNAEQRTKYAQIADTSIAGARNAT